MKHQWTALLNVLPMWLRSEVNNLQMSCLQEIRLRIGKKPTLVCKEHRRQVNRYVVKEDLDFCINTASRYSPWASQTMANGFVTTQGGHRIGICGEVAVQNNLPNTVRNVTSLCIRVAAEFPGIAEKAAGLDGNILILGRPGSGKSTLLRDLVRCKSTAGQAICVIDERQELFPQTGGGFCFDSGPCTDVLSGCPKLTGIEIALRVMNPEIIAVDEITAEEDCVALIKAGWCGVKLVATAHAAGKRDLLARPVYRKLVDCRLFETLLILQQDKSWRTERITYGN